MHNFTQKNKRHREVKKEKGEEIIGKDKEMEKEVKERKGWRDKQRWEELEIKKERKKNDQEYTQECTFNIKVVCHFVRL